MALQLKKKPKRNEITMVYDILNCIKNHNIPVDTDLVVKANINKPKLTELLTICKKFNFIEHSDNEFSKYRLTEFGLNSMKLIEESGVIEGGKHELLRT